MALSAAELSRYHRHLALPELGAVGQERLKKARVLITECTFGKSNYVFPSIAEIAKNVNSTIGMLFDKGKLAI